LASRGLYGPLGEELVSSAAQFSDAAYDLLKFHGIYEQYDRDTATERKQAGFDKEWQCMARVRIPGGRLTAQQWLALDALCERRANGTLRITTRQAIQLHGVLKTELRQTIADIESTLLTTMAACGDVARNVMTTPAPIADKRHQVLRDAADLLSVSLLPRTRAHHEIFVGGVKLPPTEADPEPLYGRTYLPRKFKTALGTVDDNSADLYANDLALFAIFDGDVLRGWNVAIGGGLGLTHNKANTYARLASLICFVEPDDLLPIAEAVVRLHRDHGDRTDRKHARLKYVVDALGTPACKAILEADLGKQLAAPVQMAPVTIPDHLGWHAQGDGKFWLGVPVPSGRVADIEDVKLRTALREIVTRYGVDPVLTPDQDVLLSNAGAEDRAGIEALLRAHGVKLAEERTRLDKLTLACPAFPTCGLALGEAERVRDQLVADIDAALARQGLAGEGMTVRITGCPNGCARPYIGDVGIVGRTANDYALFVGGDREGTRMNFRLIDRMPFDTIPATLEQLFAQWRDGRNGKEPFGDWCARVGVEALLGFIATRQAA
ncbi:MAG: NADPH-dependent assimilatory sulfite reductase hemoprotein subunit, partial [Rhodospirillales bacterium]|nr:NADPH-dependent assimilatory sulfite reductase hemoprotein subunit [Rhodospirillales bacterium]